MEMVTNTRMAPSTSIASCGCAHPDYPYLPSSLLVLLLYHILIISFSLFLPVFQLCPDLSHSLIKASLPFLELCSQDSLKQLPTTRAGLISPVVGGSNFPFLPMGMRHREQSKHTLLGCCGAAVLCYQS